MGSQLAAAQPDRRYDGVLGIWYGKAPGVDRATDALRHAVYVGTSTHGGALAIVGDDPAAKSSHAAVVVGGRARGPAHAAPLSGRSRRGARSRPPRDRDVARHRAVVGAQDRRRRRRRHRQRRPGPRAHRSDLPARRRRALPPPPRRPILLDAAHARARARDLRGAVRARAAVRGGEPAQPRRRWTRRRVDRHRRLGHHLPRGARGVRAARVRRRRRDPRARHPPAEDADAAAVRRRHVRDFARGLAKSSSSRRSSRTSSC